MRNFVASRAAVFGTVVTVAALLLPGLLSVPTAAAAPATAQIGVEQVPPELAEALAHDLDLTPAEYLNRAARAQRLHDYADGFRAEFPAEYAGAWLADDGTPVVAVTTTTAAQAAASDGYRTHIVPVSAADLERSADELNRWILGLPREVSSQINQIVIDVLNSQIVVDVANSQVGRMLSLPTLIASVKVQLSPGSGGPVQQVPMGGDTYISARMALPDAAATEITVCSFGFAATDANGNALNVSAGHCDPNAVSATPSTGSADIAAVVYVPNYANVVDSRQVGTFARANVGTSEGLDYSLIRFNRNVAGTGLDQPVIRGANGTTLAVTGTASPVVGAPVCKSGQSSAFTCGTVLADRVEVPLIAADGSSRTVSGFATSACTLAGDSGGAIVTGSLALGISSGSNSSTAQSCTEANIVLGGRAASLGIPIEPILADADATSGGGVGSGIQIRTAPAAA